jgi:type IV secretory pathway TrbD component
MTLKATDGLEVPLHRSLIEPMMIVGLPRTVALVLWTTVCAFALGLRQIWVLPIGLGFHLVCVAAAKADPYIFEILALALRAQRRLDP